MKENFFWEKSIFEKKNSFLSFSFPRALIKKLVVGLSFKKSLLKIFVGNCTKRKLLTSHKFELREH